jgi:hypothetical protein
MPFLFLVRMGPKPPKEKKTKGKNVQLEGFEPATNATVWPTRARARVNKRKKGERDKETDRREGEIRPRRKAQMRCCEHYGLKEEEEEEEEEVLLLLGSCLLVLLPHRNALESNSFGGKKKIVSFLRKKTI